MPYRKILLNAFLNFIHDKAVWVNAALLVIMNIQFIEWIKIYALLLGAIYTSFKFYKEFVKESQWWKAFKHFVHIEMETAGKDVKRQKNESDEKDNQ